MIAFAYCKDSKTGVIFIHGNNQLFTNMDIDCDGDQSDHGDGRCGTSTDTQSTTAFQDQVREYSNIAGSYVSDLNANFIPYVVFGNYGTKSGYQNFHPEEYGMQPLSVMAVVCPQSDGSNKLVSPPCDCLSDSCALTKVRSTAYGVTATATTPQKRWSVKQASLSLPPAMGQASTATLAMTRTMSYTLAFRAASAIQCTSMPSGRPKILVTSSLPSRIWAILWSPNCLRPSEEGVSGHDVPRAGAKETRWQQRREICCSSLLLQQEPNETFAVQIGAVVHATSL